MRALLALLLMFYAKTVTPEQVFSEWWDAMHFGAPCTTKIDIEEGTCRLEVKSKIVWR
jgi:ABC-type multidrug transport system permease subunit